MISRHLACCCKVYYARFENGRIRWFKFKLEMGLKLVAYEYSLKYNLKSCSQKTCCRQSRRGYSIGHHDKMAYTRKTKIIIFYSLRHKKWQDSFHYLVGFGGCQQCKRLPCYIHLLRPLMENRLKFTLKQDMCP